MEMRKGCSDSKLPSQRLTYGLVSYYNQQEHQLQSSFTICTWTWRTSWIVNRSSRLENAVLKVKFPVGTLLSDDGNN